MNTQLEIKNFRVFGLGGASVGFKPITILTGCNSSGKSSIVKSLLFLKDFFRKASDELIRTGKYRPSMYNVDFTLPELNLKSFSSAVNRLHKDQPIVISYTAKSLEFDYKVELSFVRKDSDAFDRAWLHSMAIYSPDGLVLYSEVKGDTLYLKKLNLFDSYINYEFFDSAFAANYLYIQREKNECRDPEYGDIMDQDSFDKWEEERVSYLRFLDAGPKLRSSIFDIAKSFDYEDFAEEYPHLSGRRQRYLQGLKHTWESSIIFFFPVLDHLKGLGKKDVCEYLTQLSIDENICRIQADSLKEWATKISSDYERSSFEDFIDYYREMENEELSDVMATQAETITMCGNFREGFIEGLEATAGIRFDTNNGIHFFSLASGGDSVDFNMLYRFMSCWQLSEGLPEGNGIINASFSSGSVQASHLVYDAMIDYLKVMLANVLYPNFLSRLQYVGNFQSNVKRLYSFDDKSNNLGNTIRDYIELKGELTTQHKRESWYIEKSKKNVYVPGTFMSKWVRKLGIGSRIVIDEDGDGLGAKVYVKRRGEREMMPLADEGYGISQVITFLLHIENEILKTKLKGDRITLNNDEKYLDGTPVPRKQEIPTLAIEEPEVSLHPSLQSQLTDIFFDAYASYGIEFIVETHSEYLIRRSQAIVANMKSREDYENRPFAVYYIDKGGSAYELKYQESGRFENSFGPGFFDEASRSSIQILKREKRMRHE